MNIQERINELAMQALRSTPPEPSLPTPTSLNTARRFADVVSKSDQEASAADPAPVRPPPTRSELESGPAEEQDPVAALRERSKRVRTRWAW